MTSSALFRPSPISPPICRRRCRMPSAAVRTVSIPYSDLKDKSLDLSRRIEDGFGPEGLGILSISNVPGFSVLRQNLLLLAPRLSNLPEDVKKELEDPESRYSFGWSHGKEKLESGKLDTFKGSFYANPVFDTPSSEIPLIERYPSYCRPNIWPSNSLPELEVAFKAIGKLMLDVGLLLAHHCDQYVSRKVQDPGYISLELALKRSRCHKGRLLYYFPRQQRYLAKDAQDSSWCGWHTDHGSLTGLTCGMLMKDAVPISCPDSAAGLYIKTRTGQILKVFFEEDEIAYQIGEITEILSCGYLCATPHCVKMEPCFVSESIGGVEDANQHVICQEIRLLMRRALLELNGQLLLCSCNQTGMRFSISEKELFTKSWFFLMEVSHSASILRCC